MARTIFSGPSVEPVTLAEVKKHLYITSETFAGDITPTQSLAPDNHATAASYSLVGTGVDVLGKRSLVDLNSGTNGSSGTVDAKIQDSDDDSVYTDWSGGAFTQVTEANDNAIQEIEYTGGKQWIRVVVTVAVAACDFSVTVLTEAATHSDDTYLENLIVAARDYAESFTGRALIQQTWDFWWGGWPRRNYLRIPLPPLSSVTEVFYTDVDESEKTFSSSLYIVDTDSEPGRVTLGYNEQWDTTTLSPSNPIRVRAVSGYGTATTDVPQRIRQAILLMIGELYENREDVVAKEGNRTANLLMLGYKVWL